MKRRHDNKTDAYKDISSALNKVLENKAFEAFDRWDNYGCSKSKNELKKYFLEEKNRERHKAIFNELFGYEENIILSHLGNFCGVGCKNSQRVLDNIFEDEEKRKLYSSWYEGYRRALKEHK